MLKRIYPFLVIIFIWLFFSHPYLFQNKVPFASNYQVNFFPPWSTYPELGGPVKNNAQPDIITQIYPWRYFAIEEWKSGRIPLWNPYSFSGTPHLANYQSAVLFPLNIIFFLPIKFIDAWSILVLLQPLLAALFTYIFARCLKISKNGSLISSVSFMFCGFITTWMGYATLPYAITFLPLSLYSIEKYLDTKNTLFGALLSFSILLSLFSGHFQTSLYFLITVFAYICFKIITSNKSLSPMLILYFIFGILMSMPQLLPSIEFYQESVRSQLFQKMEAIPWSYLPTLFSPDFYGNPVTRNDWFGHYAEWSSYAGTIGLSLAMISIVGKKSKILIFFLGLSIISLLLAYNSPLVSLLVYLKIPVLSTSAASRIIVLFSFSVAILAGFGLDKLTDGNLKKSKIFYWVGILTLILMCISVFTFAIPEIDKRIISQKNLILTGSLIAMLFAIVIGSLLAKKKSLIALLPFALLILTAFDMLRFATKWQAFDPKEMVFKSVDTTEFYSKDFGEKRFFGDFTAENSVYYKLQTLGGYDPLYPGRYGKFVRYIGDGNLREGERSAVVFPKKGEFVPETIDYLGVSFIAHKVSDGTFPWAFPFSEYPVSKFRPIHNDGHYQVFENTDSFKRAFLVYNTITLRDERQILDSMFMNNLSKTAVAENELELTKGGSGEVLIDEYNPTNIKIKTNSKGHGLLILTDNFYPGWSVYVNGNKEKIERVNFTFRGVVVPSGSSIIEFKYLPQSFTIGIYLALVGLFGVIILGIYRIFATTK